MNKLRILDPVVESPKENKGIVPLLDSVAGKSVFFRIQWDSYDVFAKRFRELLEERAHPRDITTLDLRYESPDYVPYADRRNKDKWTKKFDGYAAKADWAVLGLAA